MLHTTSSNIKLSIKFILAFIVILIIYTQVNGKEFTANEPNFSDTISIKNADNTRFLNKDGVNLTILTGNVLIQQGNTIFKCDSCVRNPFEQVFEAWGNVHINDADTTNIYAEHLKYFIQREVAYLDKNVRLTDGTSTLTTPSMEYNRATNVATYKNGGKVVSKKTTITSKEGVYYSDLKDAYFKKNVIIKDPAYYITSDSILYNTARQMARFIANTTIKDSTGSIVKTKEGYYDLKNGESMLGQRPSIFDGKSTTIVADNISSTNNIAKAEGNAIVIDSARGTTIIGNLIYQNRHSEAVLATQKPLLIIRQDKDSVFISADTLFSAKLTDLKGTKSLLLNDTIAHKNDSLLKNNKQKNDSTNRYFEAFSNVKIFTDSLQAISDSLFYSFQDSVFRMYKDPIVWGQGNQITGDTILLFTQNKQPKKIEAIENSLMVQQIENESYNQVQATRIDGFFSNGVLDSVRAKGSVLSIYFVQEEDNSYVGSNDCASDILDLYMQNKELYKVAFRGEFKCTLNPIQRKKPKDARVSRFKWLETKRPKNKFELM